MSILIGLLKVVTRLGSFIGKEITEVVRRPGALFSLILGPFLIMALFGVGYSGQRRPLNTVVVVPASATLPRDAAFYQQIGGPAVQIVEITDDERAARTRLEREQIDLLVIAPSNTEEQFRRGQQSVIRVEYNQIDPVRDNYVRFVAYRQVQELNRTIVERAVGEGKQYALQSLGAEPAAQIPPEVVAAPARAETRNVAPLDPTVVAFFTPAVLALVLQHMGVTLAALSLVREQLSGAMDIFRVAPVHPLEILIGKYLAFGFLNLLVGAVVSGLMVGFLGIPLRADPLDFAGVVALLTFASVGLGLLISTVVDSEQQAVQLSMLVLLASVFLSGFVLPLDEFHQGVQWLANLLPVTHGLRLLQDYMLRGGSYALWHLWALAAAGIVLFLACALTLRRALAKA